MEKQAPITRPLLRTKGFSTLHVQIFELILLGKTNREINRTMGYSLRSHVAVDHSRLVMHKLLCCEELLKKDHKHEITYPRKYLFWWKKLLRKHYHALMEKAIKPEFYNTSNS